MMQPIKYPTITLDTYRQYIAYTEDTSKRIPLFHYHEAEIKQALPHQLKRLPTDDEEQDAYDAAWEKITIADLTLYTLAQNDPWWWIVCITGNITPGYEGIKAIEVLDHTDVTKELASQMIDFGYDPELEEKQLAQLDLFSSCMVKEQESRPVLIGVTESSTFTCIPLTQEEWNTLLH